MSIDEKINNILVYGQWSYYSELALKTQGDGSTMDKLLNGALGLAGECGEFLYGDHDEESRILEAGDVLWYANLIISNLGMVITNRRIYGGRPFYVDEIPRLASRVCESVKKSAFHGKVLDTNGIYADCIGIIRIIASDYSLGYVMHKNILKLRDRYPERFKEEHSVTPAF